MHIQENIESFAKGWGNIRKFSFMPIEKELRDEYQANQRKSKKQ